MRRGLLKVGTRAPGTKSSSILPLFSFLSRANWLSDPNKPWGGGRDRDRGLVSVETGEAFCCQGLPRIAKETQIIRRHSNKTALIMISANYEMKVNFMPRIHRQKDSVLFEFSSAQWQLVNRRLRVQMLQITFRILIYYLCTQFKIISNSEVSEWSLVQTLFFHSGSYSKIPVNNLNSLLTN